MEMERGRSFLSRRNFSTPTRRPRPQQMPRADGSKMAKDSKACIRGRELGVERGRMAHAHGRGESYIAWLHPGGGEARADEQERTRSRC